MYILSKILFFVALALFALTIYLMFDIAYLKTVRKTVRRARRALRVRRQHQHPKGGKLSYRLCWYFSGDRWTEETEPDWVKMALK